MRHEGINCNFSFYVKVTGSRELYRTNQRFRPAVALYQEECAAATTTATVSLGITFLERNSTEAVDLELLRRHGWTYCFIKDYARYPSLAAEPVMANIVIPYIEQLYRHGGPNALLTLTSDGHTSFFRMPRLDFAEVLAGCYRAPDAIRFFTERYQRILEDKYTELLWALEVYELCIDLDTRQLEISRHWYNDKLQMKSFTQDLQELQSLAAYKNMSEPLVLDGEWEIVDAVYNDNKLQYMVAGSDGETFVVDEQRNILAESTHAEFGDLELDKYCYCFSRVVFHDGTSFILPGTATLDDVHATEEFKKFEAALLVKGYMLDLNFYHFGAGGVRVEPSLELCQRLERCFSRVKKHPLCTWSFAPIP